MPNEPLAPTLGAVTPAANDPLAFIQGDSPASKGLAKAVTRHCGVSASMELNASGQTTMGFHAHCNPGQLSRVMADVGGTEAEFKARKVLDQLGIEPGRCGASVSVTSSQNSPPTLKAEAYCPATP